MTESSSQVARHKPRSRKTKIIVVACVAGMIIVAGLGAWFYNQSHLMDAKTTPTLELVWEPGTQLTFVATNVDPPDGVTWASVFIKLEARPTDPDASYTYDYWEWHPSTDMLTAQNGESAVQSINSSISTPSDMIICNLTDIAGNGCVNNGDTFVLSIVGNEVAIKGVPLKITVYYGGRPMGTMQFQIGENGSVNSSLILLLLSAIAIAVAAVVSFLYFKGKTRKTT